MSNKNLEKLTNKLKELAIDNKLCIAFSNGVDSTVLLKVATDAELSVLAVTVNTKLTQNEINIKKAKETAELFNAVHKIVDIDMLADKNIAYNNKFRCYYCKNKMFSAIKKIANENGYSQVCDGTNTDDLKEYRPGLKAKEENKIRSPFAECGFSKQDVRNIALELSLDAATKPSSPCILTRFPYDTKITKDMLEKVQVGENIIKSYGFKDCRLRVHSEITRIEIPKLYFKDFIKYKDEISQKLKELGFVYITLDLNGLNSGSMDINIRKED